MTNHFSIKSLTLLLTCIVFMGCGHCSSVDESKPNKSAIAGDWSGVLDVGVAKVTLILHVQENPEGTLSATVDIVEQNATGIPIDSLSFDGEVLQFEIKRAFIKFEGVLANPESEISGKYTQAGQSFSLSFERGMKTPEKPNRPQEPKMPYPYSVEDVSYENREAGVTLSGTLTLPAADGPVPVVILIAGSGPNNRDEELLGHKPFLVLADHLTRQGIGVLRFDKRGCCQSTGDYKTATTQDFTDDVLAGVEYLKSRSEVNPSQIGLVGHSEGGMIAPMAAARSKDVAFIVLMAGPSVNGEEILYEQGALMLRAAGETEKSIALNRELQEQLFSIIKNESDLKLAAEQLREVVKNHIEKWKDQEKITLEVLEAQATAINTPWFRHFLIFDPASALRRVQAPVLAINGELDLQVAPGQNLPVIAKALEEGGNKDFTIVELPKLNHLFQTCETGALAEYSKIEETMSPTVLNLISQWILEKTAQE